MKALLSSLLVALASLTASAVSIQITYTDAANTGFYDPTPVSPAGTNPGTTLGQQRRIALEYAASRWSSQISGTIPIQIKASWYSAAPSGGLITLANASPAHYASNGSNGGPLPFNDTRYPTALAGEISGTDIVIAGETNDIVVNCNSYLDTVTTDGFAWDYDLSNSTVGAGSSFVGTMLHEIGHGLGFTSDLAADGSYDSAPNVWDKFMANSAGHFIPDMNAANRALARTSQDLFFDGTNVRLYNSGNAARLYAPSSYVSGSSLSHFDEDTFSTTGNVNELLTPINSFPTQLFGNLVTGVMRDMGYVMADTQPPTVSFSSPVNGKAYSSSALAAAGVFGITADTSAAGAGSAVGLLRTRIGLFSQGQGKWYNWTSSGFDSATFNYNNHTKDAPIDNLLPIATGNHTWRATVPAGLADGGYQLSIQAVDQNDQGSAFVDRFFSIDNSAPSLQIEPFTNGAVVFNLSGFRVLAPDAVSVTTQIRRSDGNYWTGTNWSSSAFTLTTSLNGGRWYPNAALPSRNNLPVGQTFTLSAIATDAASNTASTQLTVSRSAADTTLPAVAVLTPASGSVLTYPSLNGLYGTASDPESGISSLTVTFAHFITGGGVEFWTGSGWSASATNLPVIYDAGSSLWAAPSGWTLPSGSSLPNGSYSVQVTAINGESPAGITGAGTSFTVNYHPVYTWTGYTMRDGNPNNNSSSWGTPENWSPYGVPDVEDIAFIDNGDTVTSTISRTVYGFNLASGYLNFTNGPGPSGTLTTRNVSTWTGGTINGNWQVNSGASLAFSGAPSKQLNTNCVLDNSGTVTWAGTGQLQGNGSCTIYNRAGATWTFNATGTPFSNYLGGNQFINQGTLRNSAAGTIDFNSWAYVFGGTVDKQAGTLAVNAEATLSPGVQFTGGQSFRIIGGTTSASGTITNTAGTFDLNNGTLRSTSPSTLAGAFIWSGGTCDGDITLASGGSLSLTGGCQFAANSIFRNHGTFHWNSNSPLQGNGSVAATNHTDGVWKLESNGTAFSNYLSGNTFTNLGLLEKTSAGTTQLENWSYVFSGDLRSSAGQLVANATATLNGGAVLSGAGSTEFSSGNFALNGSVTSTVTTLKQSGGTLTGASGAQFQGNWQWTGGTVAGTLTIPVGRTLRLAGGQLAPSTVLTNRGTVRWEGPSSLQGNQNVTVNNEAGATWEFAATGQPFTNYLDGNHFYNHGLMNRTAASGNVALTSWNFHTDGTFNASAGTNQIDANLELLSGATFTGSGVLTLLNSTSLKGDTAFNGNVRFSSGTLTGDPAASMTGTLVWTEGSIGGECRIASGGTLVISGTSSRFINASSRIVVDGTISWLQGGVTGIYESGITVRNGGLLQFQDYGSLDNYLSPNHLVVQPGGTISKTGPGGVALGWSFENNGSIAVHAGLVSLNGGGTGSGSVSGDGSGVVRYNSGDHILQTGATLSGNVETTGGSLLASGTAGGHLDVKGGTVGSTGSGVFSFTSGARMLGGSLAGNLLIPAAASLEITGSDGKQLQPQTVLVNQGLLLWSGGQPIQGNDTVTIDNRAGATFRLTADGDVFANYYPGNRLLQNGTLEKTAGTGSTVIDEWLVEGAGTLSVQTGSIDFNTNVNLLPGAIFQGPGRTRMTGSTTTVKGTSTIIGGSTVEFAGANITGHADGTGRFSGGAIEWSSGSIYGTLSLASTTSLTAGGSKVLETDAILKNSGTLLLGGTGSLTGRQNSTLRNLTTGTLACSGTCGLTNYYSGNLLLNEGTMTIGATTARQTIDWGFQQTATGVLRMDVSGWNDATPEFDILQANGPVTLGGTLAITKAGAYSPLSGTTFAIVSGTNITGTFTTVQALGFTTEYSATGVLLRAASSLAYEAWATAKGLSGNNALATADPDHDGVPNYLEYAFNMNPGASDLVPVTSETVDISGQPWLVLHYRKWTDRVAAGLNYVPEHAATLTNWNWTGIIDEADSSADSVEGSEARCCRIPIQGTRDFLRMRVQ